MLSKSIKWGTMKLSNSTADGGNTPALPLFSGGVSAGFPSSYEGQEQESLDLNKYLIKTPAATFFVRVKGNSMEGASIMHDDILVVDRSLTAQDGKIVVAILNNEFTVKRLKVRGLKYYLAAENPAYKEIEITEEMDFAIWGSVTFVIHKAI